MSRIKEAFLVNYKTATLVTIVSYLCFLIGRLEPFGLSDIYFISRIFIFSVIGFAIIKSINDFYPFNLSYDIFIHKRWKKIISLITYSLLIAVIVFVFSVVRSIFIPINNSDSIIEVLSQKNKFELYFTFLAGAGISEEIIFRVVLLSLIYKITNKKWFSILVSSLIFGIYHLTPFNSLYLIHLEAPLETFIYTSLAGIIYGYFYMKKGCETAVLGHTLANWLPVLILM